MLYSRSPGHGAQPERPRARGRLFEIRPATSLQWEESARLRNFSSLRNHWVSKLRICRGALSAREHMVKGHVARSA
jgi:hypothetical protein